MIMSLPRRCPTSGAVLTSAGSPLGTPCMSSLPAEPQEEEGCDGDDTRAAEARLNVAAQSSGVKMPLTVVWRGDLDPGRPRPVVLRAYGAYGLCADVSFQPDDLPLLDRCVSTSCFFLCLKCSGIAPLKRAHLGDPRVCVMCAVCPLAACRWVLLCFGLCVMLCDVTLERGVGN